MTFDRKYPRRHLRHVISEKFNGLLGRKKAVCYVKVDGFQEETPVTKDRLRPSKYPNLHKIKAKAKAQNTSIFFALPREIRDQVYFELWFAAGLEQHIVFLQNGYTHRRCITEQTDEDERQTEIRRLLRDNSDLISQDVHSDFHQIWRRRLGSPWCNHWRCEERAMSPGIIELSPFLAMLRSCKQMYLECRESIYGHMVFVFTRALTAYDYLIKRRSPAALEMQHVRLSFLFPLEYEIPARNANEWQARISPWAPLCKGISELPKLRRVDIWLDDLAWHNRRFLTSSPQLYPFEKRAASLVTLYLPANPEDQLPGLAELEKFSSIIRRGSPSYHWTYRGKVSEYEWGIRIYNIYGNPYGTAIGIGV